MVYRIRDNVKIGRYAIVDESAIIGSNCNIDDFVSVRHGAKIGNNVVIKCRATIGLDCIVGNDCFIGAHAILLNGKSYSESTPSALGDRVFLGACACVLPGVKICSDVIIGAGAVVVKDITEPGTYIGNPCRSIK